MELVAFDERGYAEPIRFIFALADAEYTDVRVTAEEWPARKLASPWGKLPYLITEDGTKISQSVAICRYLANRYNLTGISDIDKAKCDEFVDATRDLMQEWGILFWQCTPEKKQKFLEQTLTFYLAEFNSIIKQNGGKCLVGTGISWADLYLACALEALENTLGSDVFQPYLEVMQLRAEVLSQPGIKAWVNKRPKQNLQKIGEAN